jgi:glycosyltransferase involved in cell wall biosynthesis
MSSLDNGRVNFVLLSEYSSVINLFINYSLLKRKIENEIFKNDVIIARVPFQFAFIAIHVLKKLEKPFLIEVASNGFETYWANGSILGKISAFYFDWLMKKCMKRAPYVVYVAHQLQRRYPSNGHAEIMSNVIIPPIVSQKDIEISRFDEKVMKIGLIGSFSMKYKGQHILLKAISKLDSTIKQNIELYFVGSGNYEWLLNISKKFILDKNIKFIGELPHDKIFDFLKKLSLYMQPSFQEGMPRAMLEAMSMGCPVLGSTIGGIPEILAPEYLHKPGDYKKLSQQIKQFYENRELLKNEALHNLELVKPFLKMNLDKKRALLFNKISTSINK